MPLTIRDVAKRAMVSVGSVSNVLNNRDSVKPSVRAKVEKAIEDLGYHPNRRAQLLARKPNPVLSFVLSNRELYDPFHSRILEGVSKYCEDSGFFVLFSKLHYAASETVGRLQLPAAVRTNGMSECVLLAGVNYPNLIEALEQQNIPHILFANNLVSPAPMGVSDQVLFDDVAAARNATRYLIELGHEAIWYIGDTALPWFERRYQGYLAAMREAKLKPRAQTAAISDDRFVNGFRWASSIVKAKQPLTAIFAATDEVAYGCWECLQQLSIGVPDQVSLIGFDDQRGPYKGLGLTTVRVEAETIGIEMAKMAIEKIRSTEKQQPQVVVPTVLMKRGTCQPPPDNPGRVPVSPRDAR
ncbi:transcriptional regulator, LacI family [Granulicella pectinivorans]|uniref:Transcriptional regulator, LacI family n=1 Tax=Granulicella pectinivorans TaxID=474950 RepID=A0A1I6LCQ8_9BACT|nr:LacI family DNA-binding transcriptional regulator [Granulicella pectinivorans]SFS01261.1 transcriptional regulator, LacI family [Granulicella pectinivorans]